MTTDGGGGGAVGASVGASDGASDGSSDGASDSSTVGVSDGSAVGASDGASDGSAVGVSHSSLHFFSIHLFFLASSQLLPVHGCVTKLLFVLLCAGFAIIVALRLPIGAHL